ncbi:Beta-glucosidase 1B [Colletotrichum viniferum]|nr:Beta-glucosidase 1B [Colletotrichum viniferum]
MANEAAMFQAGDLVAYSQTTGHDLPVEELRLPAEFTWGTATAAFQVEGAVNQDGKGKSIWDTYTHLESSRTNGQNADVACDHYNRVDEYLALIAALGVDVYRFSLAWTRIIPCGGRNDAVNEKGIAFYNNIIDKLLAHDIEPVVTLYHWDLPQELYDRYGAYLSIVLNGHFYEPFDAESQLHRDAAQRRVEFYIGWFGDPVFLGRDYPDSMRRYLGDRLPEFTPEERELLRETASTNAFYGMNHYSTKYARALTTPPAGDDWTGNIEESSVNAQGVEIGPVSGVQWLRLAPEGFRKLLNWVWDRYQLPVIITESGCPCPGEDDVSIAVEDEFRQRCFGLYLDAISRAIYEDGVRVEGYYAWTLMDNFGYSITVELFKRHLGFDLSSYVPFIFILGMTGFAWTYIGEHARRIINTCFMSTAEIRPDDEIYNVIMSWVAGQPFGSNSRHFIVNMDLNSSVWSPWAWRDDLEDSVVS